MTALVNHSSPYPDESLASYVERLARANHYHPPWLLSAWLRASGSGGVLEFARAIRQPEFYQRLADLTGQPVAHLFALTPHRFTPVLLPPGVPVDECVLEGQVFPLFPARHIRLLLRSDAAAFCPACLREASYHRLAWQVTAVAACPTHAAWLLDRCPRCDSPLPVSAVTVGRCPRCDLDLREHDAPPLPPDEAALQVQHCLYAWLEGRSAPPSLRLPTTSGQVLFRVLDGLRVVTQLARAEWALAPEQAVVQSLPADVRRRLAPRPTGLLYATALHGLKDWPDGFFTFLDAYQQRGVGNGLDSLGTLYSTWLERHWRHPAFAFVQAAFNRFLTSHFPPVRSVLQSKRCRQQPDLVEQFAYVDVRNAARLLGTSPPKIHRLIRDGLLEVYPESDPARPGVFLHRSQLETFTEPPTTTLHKEEAAAYLGIYPEMLKDLLAYGLLTPTGYRTVRGEGIPGLTRQDVDRLCARLQPQVGLNTPPAQGSLPLSRAAVLNGKVGLGLAGLLERVLAGKLAAYHPSPDLRPMRDLWFDEAAILGLTQQVKNENGWVGFLETAALLGVGRRVLHHWIDSGLLVPLASFARAQYFARSEVLDLRTRCVASPEAAVMLHTNRAALSQWVRAGFLQPLSGPGSNGHSAYIFDRQVLEDWRHTYISTPEAKQMLEAANPLLRRWREQGQLVRLVSDPKIPSFYRRDEVLRLQQTLFQASPAQKL